MSKRSFGNLLAHDAPLHRLVKDEKGRVDLLLQEGEIGSAKLTYVAQKRQRVKGSEYDLSQLESTSATARGTRLAPKPVARVSFKPGAKKKKVPKKKSPAKKSGGGGGDAQTELF